MVKVNYGKFARCSASPKPSLAIRASDRPIVHQRYESCCRAAASFCLLPFKVEGYPLDLAERAVVFYRYLLLIGGVNMDINIASRYYKYREDEDLAFIAHCTHGQLAPLVSYLTIGS